MTATETMRPEAIMQEAASATDPVCVPWDIVTYCPEGTEQGQHIPATGWDVWSKLAAVRAALPAGWHAEAWCQTRSADGSLREATPACHC